MRVLLVDDEIVALNALKKRVDWLHYGFTDIITAQDATTARKILQERAVDMLLCDIEMPGESGLSLIQFVSQEFPTTTCIMVTCYAEFDYIKEAMQYGVQDYILKPIDYSELKAQLESFVVHQQKEEQKNLLEQVVVRTIEEKDYSYKEGDDRIEIVKEYIDAHLQDKIYVEDLALLVHINDQHLMRVFKKETGRSITEYISEQRVLLASQLLKETDYSIQFISDCVGCEHYSYFTRLFKRFTGLTPTQYRRQHGSQ